MTDFRIRTKRPGPQLGADGSQGQGEGETPASEAGATEDAVVRRTKDGWRVGGADVPDLTSAMVLADLLSTDLASSAAAQDAAMAGAAAASPASTPSATPTKKVRGRSAKDGAGKDNTASETNTLRATIGQLEHALTARIRVEQAIGVLAERHRIQPRQAFEQLRNAARSRGRRVIDIASDVVASATNPLLQLPDELSRPRAAGRRGRQPQGILGSE
jgi:hypothetical protein